MSPTPNLSDLPPKSASWRWWKNIVFVAACLITSLCSIAILLVLLTSVADDGFGTLSLRFLTSPPSDDPSEAGISFALFGTLWVCSVCLICAVPIGVGAAIFLEEYQPSNPWLRYLHSFVQINIANLAGVPSVVYGMIGMAAFVYMFMMFGRDQEPAMEIGAHHYDQVKSAAPRIYLRVPVSRRSAPPSQIKPGVKGIYKGQLVELNVIQRGDPLPSDPDELAKTVYAGARVSRVNDASWYHVKLPFGRSVLAGGLTLMLVILPVVIIASQESLRAVPSSLRDAAYGLGATRWQVVWNVTLPAAIPGIMTGSILAMSRAIGEAAPMLMISGTLFAASGGPGNLMDEYTVMPLQIYSWTKDHRSGFQPLAASAILVLLAVLFTFNAVAIFIRQVTQKPLT